MTKNAIVSVFNIQFLADLKLYTNTISTNK